MKSIYSATVQWCSVDTLLAVGTFADFLILQMWCVRVYKFLRETKVLTSYYFWNFRKKEHWRLHYCFHNFPHISRWHVIQNQVTVLKWSIILRFKINNPRFTLIQQLLLAKSVIVNCDSHPRKTIIAKQDLCNSTDEQENGMTYSGQWDIQNFQQWLLRVIFY